MISAYATAKIAYMGWCLGNPRNDLIFNEKLSSVADITQVALCLVEEFLEAISKEASINELQQRSTGSSVSSGS